MPDLGFAKIARICKRGLVREENQDCTTVLKIGETAWLCGVFDGMGGHHGGRQAARIARLAFQRALRNHWPLSKKERYEALLNAFGRADTAIRTAESRDWALSGMGATAVAAVVEPHQVSYLHAGDCRFYHFRGGVLQQVSRDHTIIQVLLDTGRLAPEDVSTHPLRSTVTSSVGGGKDSSLDVSPKWDDCAEGCWRADCQPGDVILLSSDGVHGEINQEELIGAVQTKCPKEIITSLTHSILKAGARDNFSAIAIVY